MEQYTIRYCKLEEAAQLQRFIDTFWKKDHILATNLGLLDYQHKNEAENRYNFVVLVDNYTQEFECILGFIPYCHYAPDMKKDIWLAIWKKSETKLPPGLGTKLLDFLEEDYQPISIGSIGINDNIEQLYLKRGWRSGLLNHWYFINPGKLISYTNKEVKEADYYSLKRDRTEAYYQNRYEQHPYYQYQLFQGVYYRKITNERGTCLRVVDLKERYYLDKYSLQQLLLQEDADYIDCLNFGLPDEHFLQMGFRKKEAEMTIPQWFEPFDSGKKEIKFAYKCQGDYLIFKGDSDQDRPNILPS